MAHAAALDHEQLLHEIRDSPTSPEGTFVSFKSLAFTCTLDSFDRNDLIPDDVTFGPETTRVSHGVMPSLPAKPAIPGPSLRSGTC